MQKVKKFFKWIGIILLVLVGVYLAGPRPFHPKLDAKLPEIQTDLSQLEAQINRQERLYRYLKPDNQARIVWADSLHKQKTPISFVYIHGFGASQAEGAPVHTNIARRYGANLYLARLEDHGLAGDSIFWHFTPEAYLNSAKKAVSIAQKLGEKVVILSTSAGAGLSLYIAAHHPEVYALVLYSPAIRLDDPKSTLMNGPWGRQLVETIVGGEYLDISRKNALEKQYWSNHYRIDGPIVLQAIMEDVLNKETFVQIKCPVFMAYYYKNEEEKDKVVSVPKMLEMYDQLGTPAHLKRKQSFPNSRHHVIASYIRSADWKGVEQATIRFLDEVVHLKPVKPEN